MGFFSSEDSVKISEKTGGAYADMSDVIDDELNDIFGSNWTHDSHYDSCGNKDDDTSNNLTGSSKNGDKEK